MDSSGAETPPSSHAPTARERALEAALAAEKARAAAGLMLGSALSQSLTPEKVVSVTLHYVTPLLHASTASAFLLAPDGSALECVEARDKEAPGVASSTPLPLSAPLPECEVVRTGKGVWIESLDDMAERFPVLCARARRTGRHAFVCLPLSVEGHAFGVLSFELAGARAFPASEQAFLLGLAQQCAQALERARLYAVERRAAEERAQLLSTLAHELRNPLSPMLTALQLMRLRAPDVLVKERTLLERQVAHMARLVDELLDVSRIAGGKIELRQRPIEEVEEGGAEAAPPEEPAPENKRILLVDDNHDAAEMLAEGLRLFGYEVLLAHDGPSGLSIAVERGPDLALLDIGLPGMDGYELGQRLRRIPGMESLPLVALTGYGQSGARARSTEAGFRAHLVKPVELSQVVSLLEKLGVPPPPPRP